MGKLMKKRSDGLWGWLCPLALAAVFLLGGLAGCIYAARLSEPEEGAVASYLADYLHLLQTGALAPELGPILRSRLLLWLAVTVCGLTRLGLLGLPVLCGAQGFLLCYGCACFCRAVSGGAAAAAILFGLPALIWVPVLFWLGCQSLGSASALLRRCVVGGGGGEAVFSRLYWLRVVVGCGVLIFCALVEYAVVPGLLTRLTAWLLR